MNITKRKKIELVIALSSLLFVSTLKAQTYYPSPESSATIKAMDVNSDMSRGIANVQVPLFHLPTQGTIQVPVLLNYATSGIKVAEVASVVGAGWNLVAGGKITRIVRGRPDFPDRDYLCSKVEAIQEAHQFNYFTDCDPSPDIFVFEFLGRTGRFYLNDEGEPYTQPYQDLKISFSKIGFTSQATYDPGHNYMFKGWTITTEDGVQYLFGYDGAREESKIYRHDFGYEASTSDLDQHLISTWHLEKILAPDGTELVSLDYLSGNSIEVESRIQSVSKGLYNSDGQYEYETSEFQNEKNAVITYSYYPKYVRVITSSFGSVNFNYSLSRSDLVNGEKLTSITLNDHNNTEIKKYELDQSYFRPIDARRNSFECIGGCAVQSQVAGTSLYGDYFYMGGATDLPYSRLRLDRVSVKYGSNTYMFRDFVYNEAKNLPTYDSDFVDTYGYYNGTNIVNYYNKNSDFSRMPYSVRVFLTVGWVPSPSTPDHYIELKGASGKTPSFDDAKANILEEVHFPTGGYQKFVYGHLEDNESLIRVNQVSVFDEIDTEVDRISYNYDEPMRFGTPEYHFRHKSGNSVSAQISSESLTSLTDFDGSLVRYAKVTETHLNGTKVVREFSGYSDDRASKELYSRDNGIMNDYGGDEQLKIPFNNGNTRFWDRGLLLKETIYPHENSDSKARIVEYNYRTSENEIKDTTPGYKVLRHEEYGEGNNYYAFVATVENRSRAVLLDHKIERTYDQENDNYESVRTNYSYDPTTLQLLQSEVISNGYPTYTTEYKYATHSDYQVDGASTSNCESDRLDCLALCPPDIPGCQSQCEVDYEQCMEPYSDAAVALLKMRQSHIVNTPIETKNWVKGEDNVNKLMSANLTVFGLEGDDHQFIRPQVIYIMDGMRANYGATNDSHVDNDGNFIMSPDFRKVQTFELYSSTTGKLLRETDMSGITTGYEWDTDGNYLLATTVNGQRAEATYKPLVGKEIETDPNGNITTYAYDEQNRLKQIKLNGDVVKQFNYQLINE